MQVGVVVRNKGTEVVHVAPDRTVAEVLDVLAVHGIGAVVVSGDGRHIDGVLSERDVVRALARAGAQVLDLLARDLMCPDVVTCRPDTTVEEVMAMMTDHRVRHVPVLVDGALAGLVSIGDVVKDRIAALELEARSLQDYITHPTY